MYGFHKVKGIHDQEFKHPFFRKGHGEYLGYIKRRYSHGKGNQKIDARDGDVSPSRYFELRQQFNVLSEKVDNSSKEIERLNDENLRLHVTCRELIMDNKKSLQKSLLLLFSVLGEPNELLNRDLEAHLYQLNISIDDLKALIQTVELEHLIDQNLLNKIFRTESCRNIIDSLLSVLNKHMNNHKISDNAERTKQLISKRVYNEINQRLIVPTITNKLALNVMEEVVETCTNSSLKKSDCFDEIFQTR